MSHGLNTARQNSILHPRRVKSAAERRLVFASCQGWTEFCRSAAILHIALNIRMVSAPLSNMFTRLIELTIPGTFLYYDLNQMFGIVKNVTKRPVFHQIIDSRPLLWTSAWYLHPSQTRWDCSSSWQFLVCFCTTTWIKCSAVNKTSQNEQFFINFTIQVLRSQHPHDICLLAKHVNTVHRVDHSWYIFILRLERSVRQWKKTSQNDQFSSNLWFWDNGLLWLQYICCGEGPGEQPGMTILLQCQIQCMTISLQCQIQFCRF